MELYKHYYSLDSDQREAFAKQANTTTEYLRVHLIPPNGVPDRMPRKALLQSLSDASHGKVSIEDVLYHFIRSRDCTSHDEAIVNA